MERREEPLGNSFYRCFGSVFLAKRRRGFLRAWHAVGVLEQRSGPDPTGLDSHLFVIGLFGVGVLVVNCIVDASIFDLCKQY